MRAWLSSQASSISDVTGRIAPQNYFYAPDPSSQSVCTIGGNVAENAGGAHCLKYGFTTTHVLGLEVVLPDGSLVHLGGKALDAPGYDLAGVFVGSEGTLGIATKMILRIVKRPECVRTLLAPFPAHRRSRRSRQRHHRRGNASGRDRNDGQAGDPGGGGCGARQLSRLPRLLLVELDGPLAEVEALLARTIEICRKNGAGEIRLAQSDAERALMWKGRKAAFAAMGRISPNYIVQDGVIPRTALPGDPERDRAASPRSREFALPMCFTPAMATCIPWSCYDRRIPGQEKAAEALSLRILELCIEKGGSITGEHGVGEEKKIMMGKMFSEPDLDVMQRVRCAFDPLQLSNPTKVFPRTRLCGDKPGEYAPHPLETAGIAERF